MRKSKARRRAVASIPAQPSVLSEAVCLSDFEALAKECLSPMAWAYLSGAAGDEVTMLRNCEAFQSISLQPRVLRNVSGVDTTLELLGSKLTLPVLLAPVGSQKIMHRDGELATVAAAGEFGVIMAVSSFATTSIEDMMRAATGPVWFQLYVHPDRGFTRELIARAEAAGCCALCVTVDTPVLGMRNREARSGFRLPKGLRAENLRALGERGTPGHHSKEKKGKIYSDGMDASLTWKDIDWLRSCTKLPLVLKGILAPEDAKLAAEHGVAGIIVSNHGGRNLDTAPASIEALPRIADAVSGRMEILLDGGVRRGTDVMKALALGARAVMIGRPYIWGLAANGADGVKQILEILHVELMAAMALCGITTLSQIDPKILWART